MELWVGYHSVISKQGVTVGVVNQDGQGFLDANPLGREKEGICARGMKGGVWLVSSWI